MDPNQQSSGPNKFLIFLLGLVIGAALVGGGLYVFSNFLSGDADERAFKVTPTKEFTLSVSIPANGDTVSSDKVKISGSTGTSSVVIVSGGAEDIIVEASNGNFSNDYGLVLGENLINITAYDENSGESRTSSINGLYFNEDLETL